MKILIADDEKDKFKTKTDEDIYEVEGCKIFKIIAPEGTIIEFRDQLL